MEDQDIIDLYWQRDQQAIHETAGKYGGFLWNIAWNILRSHGDAEECVNDTYLRTWNAIPPARPTAFRPGWAALPAISLWIAGSWPKPCAGGRVRRCCWVSWTSASPPLPESTVPWKTGKSPHPSARFCAVFPGKTGSCSCGDIGMATPWQASQSGWAAERAK